jgi:hypothetical protein
MEKLSKPKTELKNVKVDLSLKNADAAVKFIKKNQLAGKNLGKKIESARVKLAQAVNEAKSIFKEMEDVKMELPSALSELIKIKNTLKENGIPTDAVDGRAQVLQTHFNIANKTSDTLSRSIGDSTKGIK